MRGFRNVPPLLIHVQTSMYSCVAKVSSSMSAVSSHHQPFFISLPDDDACIGVEILESKIFVKLEMNNTYCRPVSMHCTVCSFRRICGSP